MGFTTGSHGWGMTVQKLFRLNEKSFWGIDGRFYIITGMGDMPTTNYYGLQRERNQKSLVMLPVSFGIQHYPFQGRIANYFYPFIEDPGFEGSGPGRQVRPNKCHKKKTKTPK